MLPLLSLEQKGSGPSSSTSLPPSCLHQLPPACSSPVLLRLTPAHLRNPSFVERMPTSCSVFSVLPRVCCETEPTLTCPACVYSDSSWECVLCEECVSATVSQGFFNERVHVWKFVITHNSSVLRFPGCTRPGGSRPPCVSLYFSANISGKMASLKEKWASKWGSTEH